jgi:hypothetical protein
MSVANAAIVMTGGRGRHSAGADFWGVVIPRQQTASRSLVAKYAGVGSKTPRCWSLGNEHADTKEKTMARKKVDCDWRLYELLPEDMQMIFNDASSDGEDSIELDECRENGGSRV